MDEAFSTQFLALVAGYDRTNTPQQSAAEMRQLIKSRVLRFTDMRDRPDLFFLAHRLLATRMLGGYGIRFTVTFNLFAGSVLGLGTEDQIALLDEMQSKGELGCFALVSLCCYNACTTRGETGKLNALRRHDRPRSMPALCPV